MTIRERIAARLARWARRIVDGKTKYRWHVIVIGSDNDPYVIRWTIARNRWFKIYLHLFLRSDNADALHDHPGHNVSFVIEGGYDEWTPRKWHRNPPHEFVGSELVHHSYWPINREVIWKRRLPGDLVFRHADMPHRVELLPGLKDTLRPSISLFFMTRDVREWGFHCASGWRSRKDFTERGCDE